MRPPNRKQINATIEFLIALFGAFYAIVVEFTLLTVVIILLCVLLFYINKYFPWKAIIGGGNDNEHFVKLATYLKYGRTTFISIALFIPIICIGITEAHKRFPLWQERYIVTNLTKSNTMEDLDPLQLPGTYFQKDSNLIRIKTEVPQLLFSTKSTILIYRNETIVKEMIGSAKATFDKTAFAIVLLFIFFTILLIPIDLIGAKSLKK